MLYLVYYFYPKYRYLTQERFHITAVWNNHNLDLFNTCTIEWSCTIIVLSQSIPYGYYHSLNVWPWYLQMINDYHSSFIHICNFSVFSSPQNNAILDCNYRPPFYNPEVITSWFLHFSDCHIVQTPNLINLGWFILILKKKKFIYYQIWNMYKLRLLRQY